MFLTIDNLYPVYRAVLYSADRIALMVVKHAVFYGSLYCDNMTSA